MHSVKDFYKRDHILRASLPGQPFICLMIQGKQLVQDALNAHQMDPLSTILLGDILLGTALTAATLKGQQRVQFSFQKTVEGSGKLVAEADATGEVRGYCSSVNPDQSAETRNEMLRFALGKGQLSVTSWLKAEAQPTISTIEYLDNSPAEIFSQYFTESVQTPTACMVNVRLNDDYSVKSAYGYLIQAMPGSSKQARLQLEEHLKKLPPVYELAEQADTTEAIFMQMLEPLGEAVFKRHPVHFFCRCNAARFENGMALLPKKDLLEMASEGTQTLKCHYCSKEYHITPDQIRALVERR